MIKNKYTQATLKKYGIESDYYRLWSPLEINDLSALLLEAYFIVPSYAALR